MTTRTNLLTNPSAETNLTGWSVSGATQSQDTTTAKVGTTSVKTVTAGAVGSEGEFVVALASVGSVPYSAGAWVKAAAGVALVMQLRLNAGAATQTAPFTGTGNWQWVTINGFMAPASLTNVGIGIRTSVATATTFWVDGAIIEQAATVGAYFDGSNPPSSAQWSKWLGTANASASTATDYVSVVPNPSFTPPRQEIAVSVPTGQVMVSPVLSRLVGGVATVAPSQPSGGFDTVTGIYDYESPYDQPVSYQLVTNYFDPAGITTVWDEVWSSLAAWSGTTSGWSVSGGTATGAGNVGTGPSISRAVAAGKYRIMCAALSITGTNGSWAAASGIFLMNGSTVVLQIAPKLDGSLQLIRNGVVTSTTVSSSAPFTIDLNGSTIVVSGTGGSTSLPVSASITAVQLTASGLANTAVGRITVGAYGTQNSVTSTAPAVTLSPASSWLIHPSNPGLSMPVSSDDRSTAMIRTLGGVSNVSQVTEHPVLGQSLPITTTSGPRMGNKLQATVGVRTAAQEQALMGLLADGTPILFRAPASYPIGLEEGYYSVGDITRSRIAQRLGHPMRDFTLPLTQVQRPAVNVQNVGWSWASAAAQFASWQAEAAAFNTWADLLTNNRKPGY